jgi:hypothetical protein
LVKSLPGLIRYKTTQNQFRYFAKLSKK